MSREVLVDAGPLVAVLREDDNEHRTCVAALKTLRPPLVTTWAPITEAMYLLDSVKARAALLDMVHRKVLRIASISEDDVPDLTELMRKYADLPMDFADATLVRVARRDGISRVFTLDRRDFSVYRGARGKPFQLLP